jgi:flagellar basal body-associated protein FliL
MINKKEKKQEHQEINKDKKNNGLESIIVFIVAILFMSILSYAFLNLFIK